MSVSVPTGFNVTVKMAEVRVEDYVYGGVKVIQLPSPLPSDSQIQSVVDMAVQGFICDRNSVRDMSAVDHVRAHAVQCGKTKAMWNSMRYQLEKEVDSIAIYNRDDIINVTVTKGGINATNKATSCSLGETIPRHSGEDHIRNIARRLVRQLQTAGQRRKFLDDPIYNANQQRVVADAVRQSQRVYPSITDWAEGMKGGYRSPHLQDHHKLLAYDEVGKTAKECQDFIKSWNSRKPLFSRDTEPCWSKWGARCGSHCTPQPVPCSYLPYRKVVKSVAGTIMGMLDDREITIGKTVE